MNVSPACAGMIPLLPPFYGAAQGEPRMRGDDPPNSVAPPEMQL